MEKKKLVGTGIIAVLLLILGGGFPDKDEQVGGTAINIQKLEAGY